ncbi:kelch-like protein 10 [Saccostrea cucullata]|uniref:kelch-like protein 10 n=1 Tax=Saccostrea cuccullata TaxID=36930 RepID=UPI002ED109B1
MSVLGRKLIEAFRDQRHCDVKLKLQDNFIIDAHKTVLILGSKWFEARLGEKWNQPSGESNIINCNVHSSQHTKEMLEFLYTSEIHITLDNVEEIYQIADYYTVTELMEKCCLFLQQSISKNTVLKILNISHENNITDIKNKGLEYLDKYIEEVLLSRTTEEFQEIPLGLLLNIVKRDSLCIHEELLFTHINLWIKKVQEEDIPGTWRDISPFLRFGVMSMDFFLENVVNKGIIDNDLCVKIMVYISTVNKPVDLPEQYFNVRYQITDQDISIHRFLHHSLHPTWVVDNSLNGDRISFTINLDDFCLRGLFVYGAETEAGLVVSMYLYTGNGQLLGKSQTKQKTPHYKEIPVIFPKPLLLVKDTVYTVVVRISGGPTYYGKGGLSDINVQMREINTLKVTFQDACGDTNVQTGQIKGLILRKR